MQGALRQQGKRTGICLGEYLSQSTIVSRRRKSLNGVAEDEEEELSRVARGNLLFSSSASVREDVAQGSSVNRHEAQKFAQLSGSWWDIQGPFKPLHAMNRARCEFIQRALDVHLQNCWKTMLGQHEKQQRPDPITALDVGCGGGILSESLATMRLGSGAVRIHVTGIDVHPQGIHAAIQHRDAVLLQSIEDETAPELEYRVQSIEELIEQQSDTYDVVIASEVIEHVDSMEEFCTNIVRATKPGGQIIVSTLNRTLKSYLLAIVGAEYITRMVPKGTHEWNKFVTPEELVHLLCDQEHPVSLDVMSGMSYQPLTGLWHLCEDTDVNYIASFTKHSTDHTV